MKKLIFGIIILIALILGVGANLIYQRTVIGEMTDIISQMSETPSTSNFESAEKLNSIWEKHNRIFSFSTHVAELDNVACALSELSALAKDGDPILYKIALGKTIISLDAIKNGDDFSFQGIF